MQVLLWSFCRWLAKRKRCENQGTAKPQPLVSPSSSSCVQGFFHPLNKNLSRLFSELPPALLLQLLSLQLVFFDLNDSHGQNTLPHVYSPFLSHSIHPIPTQHKPSTSWTGSSSRLPHHLDTAFPTLLFFFPFQDSSLLSPCCNSFHEEHTYSKIYRKGSLKDELIRSRDSSHEFDSLWFKRDKKYPKTSPVYRFCCHEMSWSTKGKHLPAATSLPTFGYPIPGVLQSGLPIDVEITLRIMDSWFSDKQFSGRTLDSSDLITDRERLLAASSGLVSLQLLIQSWMM